MTSIQSGQKMRHVRLAVFLGGLALLSAGLIRGEAAFVLHRAIIICLECIGIG
jgi:hypothetical protein